MSDRSEIEWAPRVSLSKIRELYEREACGELDDELVEEVGFALFARCQSILEFSEALEGQVRCKRCYRAAPPGSAPGAARSVGETKRCPPSGATKGWIERRTRRGDELLRCPDCGWQVRWRVYLAESEKVDGPLHEGNAGAAFWRYAARYPLCASRGEKMLAIDRLIHEFHWNLVAEGQERVPHKPAGVNLLRGTTTQVVQLLNELTYGEHTPEELLERYAWWRGQKPIARRKDLG